MTNEQMICQLGKTEAVFRSLIHRGTNCFNCAYWRENEYHHWACADPEQEEACRDSFEEWMNEEAE